MYRFDIKILVGMVVLFLYINHYTEFKDKLKKTLFVKEKDKHYNHTVEKLFKRLKKYKKCPLFHIYCSSLSHKFMAKITLIFFGYVTCPTKNLELKSTVWALGSCSDKEKVHFWALVAINLARDCVRL